MVDGLTALCTMLLLATVDAIVRPAALSGAHRTALVHGVRATMLLPSPDDAVVAAGTTASMVVPGVSAAAAPWVALAIVLPTLAVLATVASDARAIGWERAKSRRFLIRWSAPYAARYELPSGGSNLMMAGEGNAEAFGSLQECLALGRQLERTFSRSGSAKGSGTRADSGMNGRGGPPEAEVIVSYDAAGNPTGRTEARPARRASRPATPLSYQIYEVRETAQPASSSDVDAGGGGGGTALVVRGSYPKQVNAQGSTVRTSAESARRTRDPLLADSLGDAWREVFEAYSTELDDEWLRFRQTLMEVGGSRLQVVSPEEAAAAAREADEGEGDDEDDDEDDGRRLVASGPGAGR